MRSAHIPSPQPSLGPVKGVLVRMNSSSLVDGSTPPTSYRCPFNANTTRSIAAMDDDDGAAAGLLLLPAAAALDDDLASCWLRTS